MKRLSSGLMHLLFTACLIHLTHWRIEATTTLECPSGLARTESGVQDYSLCDLSYRALYIHPDLKPNDDPAQKAVTYYTNNRHRKHYPAYRDQNFMIGSGSMESGCKQLGLERVTITGARWSSHGARMLAKARAAYLSRQWSAISPCRDALPNAA